ncbi:MAG: T9SS type A sorting domain-containing protein [Rubricoccaceae bacterium]|nr:T9SS type A sorting domain-containing protein [Rubricoccaceae bacterium]
MATKGLSRRLIWIGPYGWALGTVAYNGVNYDGTVIVGQGFNPDGDYEGWRAVLPPWPVNSEPESPQVAQLTTSIYPNPIRGSGTVRVVLNAPSEGRVTLSNVLGRTVPIIHEGSLGAGGHSLVLDASRLPPGAYILRAEFGKAGSASRIVAVVR